MILVVISGQIEIQVVERLKSISQFISDHFLRLEIRVTLDLNLDRKRGGVSGLAGRDV